MTDPAAAASGPSRPTVLVVDDSAFSRKMITLLLEESGFQVIGHAANGEEALTQIESLRPDIVTLDVNMPRLDGFETLRRLRKVNSVPVVMVTTLPSSSIGLSDDLEDFGHVSVVNKTFSANSLDLSVFCMELVEALKAALHPQSA